MLLYHKTYRSNIQSRVVITRPNTTGYRTQNSSNWGRTYIKICIQKDTQYHAPTGDLGDACCVDFGEKWQCYNGAALYHSPHCLLLACRFPHPHLPFFVTWYQLIYGKYCEYQYFSLFIPLPSLKWGQHYGNIAANISFVQPIHYSWLHIQQTLTFQV